MTWYLVKNQTYCSVYLDQEELVLLLQSAQMLSAGDLQIANGALDIRIDPLSAHRRTRVLVSLCEQLTSIKTCSPETNLVMRSSVKDRPGIS